MSKQKNTESESVTEEKAVVVVDDTEQAQQKPSAGQQPAPEQPLAGKKRSPGKSRLALFTLMLLVVLFALLAYAAYYLWNQQQQQSRLIEQQQGELSALDTRLQQIQQSSASNAQSSAANLQQIGELEQQLKQTEQISQQAIATVNRSQRGWALAEIDYLLRMAHQRIAVARDIGGAIAALKGADDRIQQLADLRLFKIRKQLAKDIARLNAVHQADVNGISLAIDQMIAYLPELPFKSAKDEIRDQLSEDKAAPAADTPAEDKSFVDSVLDTVKQIGDIKVHQRGIDAASSVEQQKQIEQLLRTYLLSARLAALRFNQVQFLHEISQASEILRLHYDSDDNRVQQMLDMLNDYSALQLNPDLPELTQAWVMLQKEMNKTGEKGKSKSESEK